MLEKYQHVICDLDGTLVGIEMSYPRLVIARTLQRLGDKKCEPSLAEKFWLEGDRDTLIREEFGCKPEDFWEVFSQEDLIKERLKLTRPYPDVIPALLQIRQQGKRLAVITDAPPRVSEPELDLLPREIFAWTASIPGLGFTGKPHSQSFLFCLDQYHIDSRSAVYIGNSVVDGIYARSVGVDFIQVDRGEHPLTNSINGVVVRTFGDLVATSFINNS